MKRPPRDPKKPLFGKETILWSLFQGFGVLAVILAVFAISIYRGQGEQDARALTFTSLVIANLALIATNRSWSTGFFGILRRPNAAIWWVAGGALLFLGIILYFPVFRGMFKFSTLHPIDLGFCLLTGIVNILWFESLKKIHNRSSGFSNPNPD